MKTLLYNCLWLGSFLLNNCYLYAQVYYSDGFEKKGVTEYLALSMDRNIEYWSTARHSPVPMVTTNTQGNNLVVKFTNGTAQYTLKKVNRNLICIHPNGRQQFFKQIPALHISKNFEKQGVIEYLQEIDDKIYYFTNKTTKKIRLQIVGGREHSQGYGYKVKVRFPRSSKVYQLELLPMMLYCTHPNGTRQMFDYYSLTALSTMIKQNQTLKKMIEY